MKKILITGGAGFIGSNLALKLLNRDYKVTILDNLCEQIHGKTPNDSSFTYNLIKDRVNFIKGDVRNKEDWMNALEGQHIVVHLAAETGTGQSMYEIKKYTDVNIGGTALLIDILTNNKYPIEKIIVASSRAIYGEGKYHCKLHGAVFPTARNEKEMTKGDFKCKCPICNNSVFVEKTTEDSKIHPSSIYGITKQNQEQMIMLMGKTLGIPSVSLRYQNVYGPGQSLSNPYTGILSIFSNLIRNNNEINIFEDGKESRDFVYIDDIVDATIMAIENSNSNNNIYNVGSNERKSVLHVAEVLKTAYNGCSNLNISGNFRQGDIRHNIADISKISVDMNFVPKYDFQTGIKKFVNWVEEQKKQRNYLFEKSIKELTNKGLLK